MHPISVTQVGGAESCVECALWTASAAEANPSVVNHPALPIRFLDRIEKLLHDRETTCFWRVLYTLENWTNLKKKKRRELNFYITNF